MTADNTPSPDRLEELLADLATQGLSPDERAELTRLLQQPDAVDRESLDYVAALLDQQFFPPTERLPASLLDRIAADAPRHLPVTQPKLSFLRLPSARSLAVLGWSVAACLLIGLGWLAWYSPTGQQVVSNPPPPVTLDQKFSALAAEPQSQLYEVAKAEPGQRGGIVWNPLKQEGYLELEGFPPNDARQARYQLWIVDGQRTDPKHSQPVDGGLFDVTDAGRVVIPVRAALPVGEAKAFAITKEIPSGVVVSEGPHLMVLVAAK